MIQTPPLLTSFSDYLSGVRGLEPKSRDGVLLGARRFLVWVRYHHPGQDLNGLTAEQVLTAVEHRLSLSATSGRARRRSPTSDRFSDFCIGLATTTRISLVWFQERLIGGWPICRPGFRGMTFGAIDAIGMATLIDLRDRAVLLLLATTGIRNGELRALQLRDIDWRTGEIFVRRTKGKRDRSVPLLDETGAALADYILHARPKADSPYVFLSLSPPVGPFKFAGPISRIVRRRLQRRGIELGRVAGAHLLRHRRR